MQFMQTTSVGGIVDSPCPSSICTCQDFEAICSGEYIPRMPARVKQITFMNGQIKILSGITMANLTNSNVTRLNFTNNGIQEMKTDAFLHMTTMIQLSICEESALNPIDVRNALKNISPNQLRRISFTDNAWKEVPIDMFDSLQNRKSKIIALTGNNFNVFNLSTFSNVEKLIKLNLQQNQIRTVILGYLSNVQRLDLGYNDISDIPSFCFHNTSNSKMPNLAFLSLAFNSLKNLRPVRCLPRLKELRLEQNSLKRIQTNTFAYLNSLTKLYLMAVGGKNLDTLEKGAFNSTSLRHLSLRDCNFHFDKLNLSALADLFSNCKNLQHLDLAQNDINPGRILLGPMLFPLERLIYLNLELTKLTYLPNQVFSKMSLLETLSINSNKIYGWDEARIFDNVTTLQELDVSNNYIKVVNKSSIPPQLLSSLRRINLATNQFSCTCHQMWFVNWLRSTKIDIVNYPKRYRCVQPPALNGVQLKDYKPTVESCTPWNPLFTIAISMSVFGFIIIVSITVFVRCYTNLKNYIYLLKVSRRRRQGYLPIDNSEDYEYHAFVVYCDSNRLWVHNEFVKKLENEEGFKLCIHHRDFAVGETIIGNVDTLLKKSWKVVVIMSNAFAKSEWCQWEVDIVQERRRRQGREVLLLIMLENINSKNMTSPLRTLLDSTPHLKYKKGMGEELFWKAITEGLRKPIGQPPISVL
ncbi:toll-like receptor 3 [Mytilus californianus]|uniref:toll-like receptor 3 n=1 Tax=Mytilus californianus TaxID=6549 RepID=UPI002246FF9F|nr:toll-like receptor 3 [Mytilus californianus]